MSCECCVEKVHRIFLFAVIKESWVASGNVCWHYGCGRSSVTSECCAAEQDGVCLLPRATGLPGRLLLKINHLLSYLHSTFTVCRKETKWGFFCGDMGAKGLCYAVRQLLMPVTELQGYLTTTSTIWQWKLISVLLKTMLLFTKESNPYFLFLPSKKLLNFFL